MAFIPRFSWSFSMHGIVPRPHGLAQLPTTYPNTNRDCAWPQPTLKHLDWTEGNEQQKDGEKILF